MAQIARTSAAAALDRGLCARMSERPVLLWFRNDLRLTDHRALAAAVATGVPVLPVFVLDDISPGAWKPGAASRWWLHKSLESLGRSIDETGGKLILRWGAADEVLVKLAAEARVQAVYCSRAYEPWACRVEMALRARLLADGVELKRFAGALLHEPDQLATQTGAPYKVFTPFWRALERTVETTPPPPAKSHLVMPRRKIASDELSSWQLLPTKPDWSGGLSETWQPGEESARERLTAFLDHAIADYAAARDRPDRAGTSRLSPHLHFGEITPAQCWHAALAHAQAHGATAGHETFLREIAWREFSYHLLFHAPDLPDAPLRQEYAAFPWCENKKHLLAWQRGQTGYPIVDAGMRELWATGWMHNRVRMIVASFLIKDLMIAWQSGEAWFWDTLLDADLASNAASWQWVAGSGADAAPFFRIFNPVTQGQRFDPEGCYVRRWVPELEELPAPDIHAPWEAPRTVLAAAGIELGKTYPLPIVDHAAARARALAAFERVKATARSGR
jgi:deoxyribodipyrimidine photo-lyase